LDPDELAWSSLTRQSDLLARRACTPADLAGAYLARIRRLDGRLGAWVTVTAERALADAAANRAELLGLRQRGPMQGIPVGVDDAIDVAEVRTARGSRDLAARVPTADATIALRLRTAGTVLLGKLAATDELSGDLATGETGLAPTRNPWDTERIAGSSSGGGAAAVAAARVSAAVGTDSCGGVRVPAAFNGCVGLKATRDLVPLAGVRGLAPSLDHAGIFGRTVADACAALDAVASSALSGAADAQEGLSGMHVGVLRPYFCDQLDDDVATCFDEALEQLSLLGAALEVVDADIPDDAASQVLLACSAEALRLHGAVLPTPAGLGRSVVWPGTAPTAPSVRELWTAHRAMARITAGVRAAFAGHDVLVCPTAPTTAPLVGRRSGSEDEDLLALVRHLVRCSVPFNVTGMPALSLPCGFAGELPVGMQFVGRVHDEANAVRAAAAYERATPWHEMHPLVEAAPAADEPERLSPAGSSANLSAGAEERGTS
jgi:Asp-tRNA(Asn)/Glu-tRNA(Gln) amidotransferase A subunit family amidase